MNALDAAFVAYAGISALRQQIRPEQRVHGVISGRDWAPNSTFSFRIYSFIMPSGLFPLFPVGKRVTKWVAWKRWDKKREQIDNKERRVFNVRVTSDANFFSALACGQSFRITPKCHGPSARTCGTRSSRCVSASCIASSARETIRGISLTNFFFASAFCPLVTDLAQVRQGAAMKSTSPNATSICGRIQSSVRPGFNPRRMGRPLFFTQFSDLSPPPHFIS